MTHMNQMARMAQRLIERIWQRLPRGLRAPQLLADGWRRYRIAPVIALVLALVALFASTRPEAGGSLSHSGDTATTRAAHVVVGVLPASHPLIGSADFHIETVSEAADDSNSADGDSDGDSELEMNLAISQTASDCQTPLYGEFCLRYNIILDDAAVQSGYGLIPVSDVTVTGTSVTLSVDTRHEPRVIRTAGAGGLIQLIWTLPTGLPRPALHTAGVAPATVRGRFIQYAVPADGVTAAVLVYGSA